MSRMAREVSWALRLSKTAISFTKVSEFCSRYLISRTTPVDRIKTRLPTNTKYKHFPTKRYEHRT